MFIIFRYLILTIFLLAGCAGPGRAPPDVSTSEAGTFSPETLAAAEKGDIEAQIQAGDAASGMAEALKWYCEAAHQGSAEAQYRVGLTYARQHEKEQKEKRQNTGPKNLAAAMVWLDAAIRNGAPEARDLRRRLAVSAGRSAFDLYGHYTRLESQAPCSWEEVHGPLASPYRE